MRSFCFVTLAGTVLAGRCHEIQATLEEVKPSLQQQGAVPGAVGAGVPGAVDAGVVGAGPGGSGAAEAGDPETQKPTYSGSARAVDCLSAFNEARAAAGLPSFVSAGNEFRVTDLSGTNSKFVDSVCESLMTQTPFDQSKLNGGDSTFNRTIALAVQDGDNGDCAAAVTHFNGALSLFGDLPPAFSTDENSVYRKLQAVSFVALYNPKENPKLDCGYFTCTKSTPQTTTSTSTPTTTQTEPTTPPPIKTKLHGLLCASSPPALIVGQAPFGQEQFDKIKGAINSASSALPVFVTLALAAAGVALF